MRTFRDEDVRERRAVEGDGLHERLFVRDERGCELVLFQLRAEHAALAGVREAWLAVAERNFRCQVSGILPVIDFGLAGETVCATRERAADVLPLSALLALLEARNETVSTLLAVHIARELCAILRAVAGAADGPPLLHGDLSAERVLVRESGRLMLTELGFWTALPPAAAQRARGAGPIVEHLAPEVRDGLALDARTDVYSLGVLLRRMLVPGASAFSRTLRVAPAMPPREMAMLIGRLVATAPRERPDGVAEVARALGQMESHAAGTAVLSQLYEDARHSRIVLHPPADIRASGQKTAMFFTPKIHGAMQRPGPATGATGQEGTGGFRGRTQIFGSPPLAPIAAQASTGAEPPKMIAGATHGAHGTLRLTPFQSPAAALDGAPSTEVMPPMLTAPGSEARGTTSRLDLTGMPPLLHGGGVPSSSQAQSSAAEDAPPLLRHGTASAARALPPPAPSPSGEEQSGKYALVHASSEPNAGRAARTSGWRLSGDTMSTDSPVPSLAAPDGLRPRDDRGPERESGRRRAPWREASETVFKLKAPAMITKIASREGMSATSMFVIAMILAGAAIVIVGLLVRLLV